MKPSKPLLFAVASFLAAAGLLTGAVRPRYGGTLRVEMQAALRDLLPAAETAELVSRSAAAKLAPMIFETLVRLSDEGRPEPSLAASWQPDERSRRWQVRLRTRVTFHDGSALTPARAAEVLNAANRGWKAVEVPDGLVLETERPMPDLPLMLADPSLAIVLRREDGAPVGTGPFRLSEWHPARSAVLVANEDYWGGRPFLDTVRVEMGRSPRDQLLDLEVEKADFVELPLQETRRASSRPAVLWSTAPLELLALVCERGRPNISDIKTRQALARSIDRAAIHTVLLQRRGAPAEGLLPGWLSGYAFLFDSARDPGAMPRPAIAIVPGTPPLELSYDAADPLAKAVAERIAVDARAAGILIQTAGRSAVTKPTATDLRLVRIRIHPPSPASALSELVTAIGLGSYWPDPPPESLQEVYAAERSILESGNVIPLVHLPEVYAVSPRVRSWNTPAVLRTGEWRFQDVWVLPESP